MKAVLTALKKALDELEPESLDLPTFRRAAVLVPLLDTPDGLELLYTVRSGNLSNHAGQIAFPGGRLDEGEDVVQAALRETFEEIGVRVAPENVLGTLHEHPSPAKYIVTPVVAVLDWPQPLVLNEAEVTETFSVPLGALLRLTPRTEERSHHGFTRTLHYYDYLETGTETKRVIWGLTGNVTKWVLEFVRPFYTDANSRLKIQD